MVGSVDSGLGVLLVFAHGLVSFVYLGWVCMAYRCVGEQTQWRLIDLLDFLPCPVHPWCCRGGRFLENGRDFGHPWW